MTAVGRIGLIPWGDVLEDFVNPLGLTPRDLAETLSDGWLFGYAAALASQGWQPEIIAITRDVPEPSTTTHHATGIPIHFIPTSRTHQILRRLGDREGRGWEGGPMQRNLTAVQKLAALPVRRVRGLCAERGIEYLMFQEYEYARTDVAALRLDVPGGVHATYQGANASFAALERAVRRRAMQKLGQLVSPATSEVERVRRVHGRAIEIVPNPIDTESWSPRDQDRARAELGIAPGETVFVCHGRIDIHRKGLDILLEAWARHGTARTAPTRLVTIGQGQDGAAWRAMIEPVADVEWIDGYETSRPAIRRWLHAADAYVSASRLEGMPVAPLEAMACGRAVLLSDAPGLADIDIGSGAGWRHPVGDVNLLAQHLTRASQGRGQLLEMGRAARAIAVEEHGSEAVGRRLTEVLTSSQAS